MVRSRHERGPKPKNPTHVDLFVDLGFWCLQDSDGVVRLLGCWRNRRDNTARYSLFQLRSTAGSA